MQRQFIFTLLFIFSTSTLWAQPLQPGFNRNELYELLCISIRTGSGPSYFEGVNAAPAPQTFQRQYRSPEIGLMNLWELWCDKNKHAVISIRGTVPKMESWMVNFHAAMVPAKGTTQPSENIKIDYDLSEHPQAAVHVGWLNSMLLLARDMQPKIDSLYQTGCRDFYITGHSQGGGIAYLLTAYLRRQQTLGKLPNNIRFKTYCTAAPKPGNLFFAYTYELATQAGWAYNVVNADDWIPEMPFAIQTTRDLNPVNPFPLAKGMIKKQKFPQRLVLKHIYNNLEKYPRKAQRQYERWLGMGMGKMAKKKLKGYEPGPYVHSNHFVRSGAYYVLQPSDAYYKIYPKYDKDIFVHHYHHPYLFLLDSSTVKKTNGL
jgi:hypothetical protein